MVPWLNQVYLKQIRRELFGFAGESQANAPVISDTAEGSSIVSLKYGGRT